MLTCPLAPRRNHTTLESHNTMSKCSHLCQHERGYQIRPATLTCPLAPRRNHTTLESHNTMSKCSHLCQHERGYQIRPATLTSPSIFLQNLIPAWIAEDGFPPTIWQMLLPSSRTTRSDRKS